MGVEHNILGVEMTLAEPSLKVPGVFGNDKSVWLKQRHHEYLRGE